MSLLSSSINQVYSLLVKRSDKCSGDSQQCEKPSVLNGGELAAAICIPVVVVALVLGGLAIRAYKVNKKEEKEFENDPDFYKNYEEYINTTDMPVYPPPAYNNHNMLNNDSTDQISTSNKTASQFYPPNFAQNDRRSLTPNGSQINLSRASLNPFDAKDDRYPLGAISNNGSNANLHERKFT